MSPESQKRSLDTKPLRPTAIFDSKNVHDLCRYFEGVIVSIKAFNSSIESHGRLTCTMR